MYYHFDTWLVWTTFLTVIFFLAAIHYHWQNQKAVKRLCVLFGVGLFLGCLVWQYRLIPKSEPLKPLVTPTLKSLAATPEPNLSPSPAATQEAREFLDIDPEKLLDFFEKYNEAQADDLVKPYIGKWMETGSGVVVWVRNESIFPKGIKTVKEIINGVEVGFSIRGKKKRSPEGLTVVEFDEQRWVDRARVLRPFKDTIKVRGQIRYIFSYGFSLQHCEIIE